ncbi:MAG: hypothetical protein IJ120_10870 [Solobacterium sp.]|nr:hypothetical protein [Solobacterium sp.]
MNRMTVLRHRHFYGVPSGVISVPSRYAHSNIEMIDLRDYEACGKLLQAFVLSMRSADQFAFLK